MKGGNSKESLSKFGVSHRNSIQNIVGTLKTRVNRQETKVLNIAIESKVEEIETPAERVFCQPLKCHAQPMECQMVL
jgi:hypothetical protein